VRQFARAAVEGGRGPIVIGEQIAGAVNEGAEQGVSPGEVKQWARLPKRERPQAYRVGTKSV